MAKRALSGLSVGELQRELQRRERGVEKLIKRRDRMMEKVQALDSEIASLGAMIGRGRRGSLRMSGRRRPRNDSNLADALVAVLKTKTLSVTEVAQVVQDAGYVTTSPNFRTIVNQTLIKDKRIKRVGRGLYTSKAGAGGGPRGRKKKEASGADSAG